MVVLRFKRFGRIHRPFFRLCATDQRAPRDGAVIEELGWYDPGAPEGKQWKFDMDRVQLPGPLPADHAGLPHPGRRLVRPRLSLVLLNPRLSKGLDSPSGSATLVDSHLPVRR